MKQEKRKMIEVAKIKKIAYRSDVTIVYLRDEVFICEPNSEKYLPQGLVEYTLKKLENRGENYERKCN